MKPAPLDTTCPSCAGSISATPDLFDRVVRCPHCRHEFTLAEPRTDRSAVPQPVPSRPARRFNFQCHRCGSILEGRSDQSGQSGKCPTCEAVFTIPILNPRTGRPITDDDPQDDEAPTPMHAYAAAGEKAPDLIQAENGDWMTRCPRCGRTSPVESNNCTACGLPFSLEGVTFQSQVTSNGYAVASLVLGLVSLPTTLCVGLGALVGLLAVFFGIKAWRVMDIAQNAGGSRSMAMAGILAGIIGITLGGYIAWTARF